MTTNISMHRPVFEEAQAVGDDLGVTVRINDPDGRTQINLFFEDWDAWQAIVDGVDAVRAGMAAGRAADLAVAVNEKASEPGLYELDGRRYDVRLNRNTGRLNAFDASGVYAKGVIQRLYRAHKVEDRGYATIQAARPGNTWADVPAPTRRSESDEDDLLAMFDK